MAYYRSNVNSGEKVKDLPEEYVMKISGNAGRGGEINTGRQPHSSVSATIPWSVMSKFYDTCIVSCSDGISGSGGHKGSTGTGTYHRGEINNDITVTANCSFNTSTEWSWNATFTARFFHS